MKKLIALLVALLLAFSCIGAVAEEASAFSLSKLGVPAFTATSSISIDQEQAMALLPMFGVPDEYAGIVQALLPVVANLGARLVYNGSGAGQFDLLLKDTSVVSAALSMSESTLSLVSNVIPSYVLTVSTDAIKNLVEQVSNQLSSEVEKLDMEAIMNAAMKYAGEFMETVQSTLTIGEAEVGEFVIEDVTFNAKVPITVDAKAVAVAALNMVKKMAQDEAFASILASAGEVDLSKLDEAIANVENSTEENTPDIAFDIYSAVNEDGTASGDTAVVVTVDTKTEQAGVVNVTVLAVQPVIEAIVEAPTLALNCVAVVTLNESGLSLDVDATIQGLYIGDEAVITFTEQGIHEEEALYFMNEESPLLTDVTDIVFGTGEVTMDFDAEGKIVLPVEQLMTDEEGQLSGGLLMDVMSNGLSSLIGNASSAMPEEVANLMNFLMPASETAVGE